MLVVVVEVWCGVLKCGVGVDGHGPRAGGVGDAVVAESHVDGADRQGRRLAVVFVDVLGNGHQILGGRYGGTVPLLRLFRDADTGMWGLSTLASLTVW